MPRERIATAQPALRHVERDDRRNRLRQAGNGVEQKTSTISPGSSATLTVNLSKAGTYDVYCPIDGHRSMGMEAKLTVGGSGGSGGGGTGTTGTTSGGGGGIPGY